MKHSAAQFLPAAVKLGETSVQIATARKNTELAMRWLKSTWSLFSPVDKREHERGTRLNQLTVILRACSQRNNLADRFFPRLSISCSLMDN